MTCPVRIPRDLPRFLPRWLLAVALQAAIVVSASPALARDPSPPVQDTTSYTFDDELVGGDGVSPDAEILQVRKNLARESLIRIREHFVVELCKSVENL